MKSGHDTTTIPSAPAPAWDANVSDDSIPLDALSLVVMVVCFGTTNKSNK